MSLGGECDVYAMAAAPLDSGGCANLRRLGTHGNPYPRRRHRTPQRLLLRPHILRYFDHPEVVAACIPPRPFMMVAPIQDEDMPRKGVDELIQVVAPVYASLGYSERFKVYQPEGNHRFHVEYFEWMVEWFSQFLTDEPALSG